MVPVPVVPPRAAVQVWLPESVDRRVARLMVSVVLPGTKQLLLGPVQVDDHRYAQPPPAT